MTFDLTTGLEVELCLPEGMGRLDLLAELAAWADAHLEIFPFVSRVPVPALEEEGLAPEHAADAVVELIQRIAEHHQAMLHSVEPDGAHFFLIHRAGRLVADDGSTILTIVHDNTIPGGERVAEVVTPPFLRARLPWIEALFDRLRSIPGAFVPEAGALHVHVDGRPFLAATPLARLVATYLGHEAELRALLETPPTFRAAGPLPDGLPARLEAHAKAGADWPTVRADLAALIPDRKFGLNLYNLVEADPEKLTVELKLSKGTLDPGRVVRVRELAVALAHAALDPSVTFDPRARLGG